MFDYPGLSEKRYRKRKDRFKNITLDLMIVGRPDIEMEQIPLDVEHVSTGKKFDLKREANRLVKRLAKEGAFSHFSARDLKVAEIHGKLPKGWVVVFRVPPIAGGQYNSKNLFVTTADVNELMYSLYWKQIVLELNSARHNKTKIDLVMPKLPDVFTLNDFLSLVQSHERFRLEKFLATKEKWRQKSLKQVCVSKNRRRIILRLQKSSAVPDGMKKYLIKAENLSVLERDKVKAEYLCSKENLVRQALGRGDFAHLPVKIQAKIAQTGHVPAQANLTCHHIIPRALGGKNEVDNLMFINTEAHKLLHSQYIDPLIVYFDSLISEKRPIFFEIPVPQGRDTLPLYTETRGGIVVRSELFEKELYKRKIRRAHKMALRKMLQKTL